VVIAAAGTQVVKAPPAKTAPLPTTKLRLVNFILPLAIGKTSCMFTVAYIKIYDPVKPKFQKLMDRSLGRSLNSSWSGLQTGQAHETGEGPTADVGRAY